MSKLNEVTPIVEGIKKKPMEKKKTKREEILDLCTVKDSDFLTLLPEAKKKKRKTRFKRKYKTELSFAQLRSIREAKIAEEKERKKDYLVETGRFTREEVEKLNDLEVELFFNNIDSLEDKINLQKELLYEEQLTDLEESDFISNLSVNTDTLQYIFSYIIEYEQVQSKFYMSRFFNYNNLSSTYKFSLFNYEPKCLNTHISNPVIIEDLKHYYERSTIIAHDKTHHRWVLPFSYKLHSNFFFYRHAFFKFKNTLFRNELRYRDISDQEYPKLTRDMVNEYLKFKHYKYPNYLWHIIFQDPIVEKLMNLFVRHGKKEKCEKMIIKIFFLLNYHLHVNPIYLLKTAIENVRPYLCAKSIPFGRRTKVVPHPVSEKKQLKLVFKWFKLEIGLNKKPIPFYYKIIEALSNAFMSRGYAYSQMVDMHNKAYSNRVYMYSNYYLKSTKVQHLRPF